MPFAIRERIWDELPPLDGEPEVKIENKEKTDESGKTVVVAVRTETVRKLKCVEERKAWPLFGLSEEDIAANDGMSEVEESEWENPISDMEEKEKPVEKKTAWMSCRFCGGSHSSFECPMKPPEGIAEAAASESAKPAEKPAAAPAASGSGTYNVKERLGLLKGTKSAGGRLSSDRPEGYQIRISHLSENAREADVRELCASCFEKRSGRRDRDDDEGRILRCFVKMNAQETKSLGFAFVTFAREQDAKKVCEKLDRHPYDHMILQVELRK